MLTLVIDIPGATKQRVEISKADAAAVCKSISLKKLWWPVAPRTWADAIIRSVRQTFSNAQNYTRFIRTHTADTGGPLVAGQHLLGGRDGEEWVVSGGRWTHPPRVKPRA